MAAGIFALIVIAAMSFLSIRLGRLDLFATPGYTLYAVFDNITGLKARDRVEIAGVSVGKVSALSLRNRRPQVSMQLDKGVEVYEDATAAIKPPESSVTSMSRSYQAQAETSSRMAIRFAIRNLRSCSRTQSAS
jgi:ABC-type transporter Mla subunit MlaD